MQNDHNTTKEMDIETSAAELQAEESTTDSDFVVDEDAELGGAAAMKKLREKLKIAIEEKQTYLDGWQRDKAEFINARKRDEDSKQEFLKFAKQGMVEEILPVLDSFDMAMMNKSAWESVTPEWRSGMEGIYNQLLGILTKNGVNAFGAIGDAFDPIFHQSIGIIETNDANQDHKVAEVMQKGYTLNGKVIRPAFVKVFQAK